MSERKGVIIDKAELVTSVTHILDLAGVGANALLAASLARKKQFDVIGFLILAIAAGLGGGMLRDVLLQQGTPVALTHVSYLITAVVAAAFGFVVHFERRWWTLAYGWVDALAVGCWATAGTQKAISFGLGWFSAVLLGVITVVGGGIIRDILLQRQPVVFGGNTLYAVPAIISSVVLIIFIEAHHNLIGLIAAMVIGSGLCLLAKHFGWTLPAGGGYLGRPRSADSL